MFDIILTVNIIWFSLALCFMVAFCLYKFSLKLPYELDRVFQDLIRYGKTKDNIKRQSWQLVYDVSKRCFYHFYAVSVMWNGLLLLFSLRSVVIGEMFPDWLMDLLWCLTGRSRTAWKELQLSVLLLQVLLWIHSLRRLLECLFVSVFSNGVIHVVQYTFGLAYYVLLGLTVLCINASSTQEGVKSVALFYQLTWHHVIGTLLFVWASLLQHRSLSLLANLRTDHSGKVETLAHKMPQGGWFDWVSCPHYLAELLIYTAMSVCCGCSSLTCWLVVLYVLCNQALAAQLCHDYYRSKFETYPCHRKAFIPFIL
ncbi:polyprenol reductase [Triplophysa rosa]|uniref:Polyprenal reductase n=1 Tax=Triplophysa rosa TaxID=992332 RepID=A0A9W7TMW9_TRIRA|nr:polyprenol reductase [Triplophysa rosa]KAI7800247.1 polyprenol reductase precursor [Triplophysa rosa]